MRWTLAIVTLLAVHPASGAELSLRFLDVGQGDAVLLSHEGKHVLVDTGPSDLIVEHLRSYGVARLELLAVSHNHADHLGGADAVLRAFPVERYLDNELPSRTKIQSAVLDLVAERKVRFLALGSPPFRLGDLEIEVWTPPENVEGDPQNNASVGLLIKHAAFRALLTGDSEVEEINAWLQTPRVVDVDVLKAAHHGSRNGVTPLWLSRTKPEVVVVSCGAGNLFGHPHEAAMRYYETAGRRVLRTDIDGDVTVKVDDAGAYTITTSKTVSTPTASPAQAVPLTPAKAESPHRVCCRVCKSGKACGDGCIGAQQTCRREPGCACGPEG